MLYHNVKVLAHAGSAIDAAVVCLGALVGQALCARAHWTHGAPDFGSLGLMGLAFVLAFVTLGGRMRLYHPWRTESLVSELVALSEATVCAMGLAILAA